MKRWKWTVQAVWYRLVQTVAIFVRVLIVLFSICFMVLDSLPYVSKMNFLTLSSDCPLCRNRFTWLRFFVFLRKAQCPPPLHWQDLSRCLALSEAHVIHLGCLIFQLEIYETSSYYVLVEMLSSAPESMSHCLKQWKKLTSPILFVSCLRRFSLFTALEIMDL